MELKLIQAIKSLNEKKQMDPQNEPNKEQLQPSAAQLELDKFCKAVAQLKAQQPPIEVDESMKCQFCSKPYDTDKHIVAYLSCKHHIGQSCLASQHSKSCPFNCKQSYLVPTQPALFSLMVKELKKQEQL
ncbi:hypothetical protein FGO68_gene5793 [Halteria grandinella]|uniref:RING-type domain-containing protein n=1 Tax=Halteria grandinella TaxID=5974 RepID=A0A8J8NWZ4_HALGN|nr:hypothetical protein FGO68_gene5793 [Halteria grandinella]